MATAALKDDTSRTIHASFTRHDGELRVIFSSDFAEGFGVNELDVLQAAIDHARRQMLDDGTPTLTVLRPESGTDDDMQSRYRTQLRRQVPVPS